MRFRCCLVLQFIVMNSFPNCTPDMQYNNRVLICWLGGNGGGAAVASGKQDH